MLALALEGYQRTDVSASDLAAVLRTPAFRKLAKSHWRTGAKEMVGFANLPDGSVRPLIHIREWDFRWQHVFRYVTPFWLPKGTRLQMRYTYDNSPENPRNPNQPPERVYWGQRSADEMGDLQVTLAPKDKRSRSSHEIALDMRQRLKALELPKGASVAHHSGSV